MQIAEKKKREVRCDGAQEGRSEPKVRLFVHLLKCGAHSHLSQPNHSCWSDESARLHPFLMLFGFAGVRMLTLTLNFQEQDPLTVPPCCEWVLQPREAWKQTGPCSSPTFKALSFYNERHKHNLMFLWKKKKHWNHGLLNQQRTDGVSSPLLPSLTTNKLN